MESDGLKIGVIGAGAWGTALARLLASSGNSVQLWCHEPETKQDILQKHVNTSFLPDILLPETLGASTDLLEIVRNSRILVAAPPSHLTREIAKKYVRRSLPNIFCSFLAKELNSILWH
jgi:Glycerol-3-phosphate dehydrogenase